jgi:hypothetical protein
LKKGTPEITERRQHLLVSFENSKEDNALRTNPTGIARLLSIMDTIWQSCIFEVLDYEGKINI